MLTQRHKLVLTHTTIALILLLGQMSFGQQLLGSITGTVTDTKGAIVSGATVVALNPDTNAQDTAVANGNGSYSVNGLPIGTYTVSFAQPGFQSLRYAHVLVQANRTTTLNASLQPGDVSATVTVNSTPLLNETDTTNGYVLGTSVIEATPLGTGSFTQLATLSPGVSADFLSGTDTNAGLGNQSIFSNGQRDTSNSFSINGISSNNLFNGKSSSAVGENRFVLNTGENFLRGGQIQTNTSVYSAIGQGLPSPPPETIDELRVNTSMYDASQGSNSGAHIEVITKSGTNEVHGELYGYRQTDALNAAPFFFNADPAIPASNKVPTLHRSTFGGLIGGPIIKNKLFFFASYQGVRVRDSLNSISTVTVPLGLTNDRSAATLANQFGLSSGQINPAALALLKAKSPTGGFLLPTPTITDAATIARVGGDATVFGPPSTFVADQINGNLVYELSNKDRFSGKYYFQRNPTTSPFAVSNLAGFTQRLDAGSQLVSLDNSKTITPNLNWELKGGFVRERVFAVTDQAFTPESVGIDLFGGQRFPGITINNADPTIGNSLTIGPVSNFSNTGVFQNQFSGGTDVTWVRGRHTLTFGGSIDHDQLNVVNLNNLTSALTFNTFQDFLTGTLRLGQENSVLFNGTSNRYYRSNQIGAYVHDHFKLKRNLTISLGLRFDYDGPLTEKFGKLTNFYPQLYKYDQATDTIVNNGLVVAGNNPNFATPGVNDSTLLRHQYGFAPRLGIAWSPSFVKNLVVRVEFGLFYDRGQFFSEFSPSAGFGFNGPFGVTLEPPFIQPVLSTQRNSLSNPFGQTPPPAPTGNPNVFAAQIPNQAGLEAGANPFLFGGYDPTNRLPYSTNWSFDVQWQPRQKLVLTLGYVGNHGQHLLLPIPFNQPGIATPQHPVNGQIYSYGYQVQDSNGNALLSTEPFNTSTGGNTDLRVPYIGYSPNSVFWEAEGISNYHALQFSVSSGSLADCR